jgi:predicted nucleic acid-binding protein
VSFFVDANVFVYTFTATEYREPCLEILDAIASGDADGVTSAIVLEEVWHLERKGRSGDLSGLTSRAFRAMTPLLSVSDEAFALALDVEASNLETRDHLHVGTCLAHGLETIVTADRGFDSVRGIKRVDPLDDGARRRLLRRA